jgi:hypothetical protein
LDSDARRSCTGLYCSRHCAEIRLAFDALEPPKKYGEWQAR